jgi:hypothetical protein
MPVRRSLTLVSLAVCFVGVSALQGAAPRDQATPERMPTIIVAVHMPTSDLMVTDLKFRVLFNKEELKAIPLVDFDFAANLSDELVSVLAKDRRAQWRMANSGETKALAPLFEPVGWKAKTFPLPTPEADRVFLVRAAYGAFLRPLSKRIWVKLELRLAERESGKVLWRNTLSEDSSLPDTLEDIQADNQKVLKEHLNKLMEAAATKVATQVAKSKI